MVTAVAMVSSSSAGIVTAATTEALTDEENDGRPPLSPTLPHSSNNATATATATATADLATTATTSTSLLAVAATATSDTNGRKKQPVCGTSGDTTNHRLYRILALSMVAIALVFGAGFGLGMRYSKSTCRCQTTADSALTIEACQELLQRGKGDAASNSSDDVASTTSTVPPISNPSLESSSATVPPLVPPLVNDDVSQRTSCLDDNVAMAELRQALLFDAHYYIHEYAHYLRLGGNNTIYPWFENDDDEQSAMMVASEAATETTNGNASSSSQSSTTNNRSSSNGSRRLEHLTFTESVLHGGNSRFKQAMDHGADSRQSSKSNRAQRQRRRATASRQTRRLQDFETSVSFSSENGDLSSDNSDGSTFDGKNAMRVADIVQTNGVDVFLVYDDEIVVLHAATNAIRRRLQVPKGHKYSTDLSIDRILLVTGDDSDGNDSSSDSTDDLLVVFYAETQYTEWSLNSYSSEATNSTVLVYNANMNSNEGGTILARRTLPGLMAEAFAIASDMYVVTSRFLDIGPLWDSLSPASLQSNKTVDSEASMSSPPRLLLNATQYVDLAFQQLDRLFDARFAEMAAHMDCTGFVSLLNRPERNDTNSGRAEMTSLVNIVSFDMSSSSSLLSQSSTTSFLPGSSSLYDWNMHLSDAKLVLACELWSGAKITNTSQPLTWLIAFSFYNATVELSSTGIVPGVLRDSAHLNVYRKNESDYLRIVTARYNNLADYLAIGYSDDPTPLSAQVSVLVMVDRSSDSGNADDYAMTKVGEVTDFGAQGANSSIASTLFEDNVMYMLINSGIGNDTKSILYSIDMSDPNNPHLSVGQTELEAYSSLYLYRVDESLLLGVGDLYVKWYSDNDDTFRILLLNVSSLGDASSLPVVLVDQGQNENAPFQTSGTRSEVIRHWAELYDAEALQYVSDLHILVVPGRTERHEEGPCSENGYMEDAYSNVSDIMGIKDGSETCQFGSSTLFNGFWLFKVDAANATISKHLSIDHTSSELIRQSCITDHEVWPRAFMFDGDVMTIKRNAAQSHDVLTKTEAAPAAMLSAECGR